VDAVTKSLSTITGQMIEMS